MEDWTFTCSQGDWTRFDNISRLREELVRDDDLNGESGTLRELREDERRRHANQMECFFRHWDIVSP